MFNRSRKDKKKDSTEAQALIDDALAADPARIQEDAGALGKAFISAVDKAVHLQTGTIRAYVNWLRRQNPDAAPEQIQEQMAKHFRTTVAGTGAGAGAAAAVPGIGLVTGAAAIAGESLLFLDLAAFYTVASAYLRGEDISDPERRRAIVLTTLMGAQGVAVVDALLGDDAKGLPGKSTLAKFSGPTLANTNNVLERIAMRSLNKKMRRAMLGKLMPLGLGAIAGTAANQKLAQAVEKNTRESLGAAPAHFAEPLPDVDKENANERDAESSLSANPREFAAWIMRVFGRGDKSDDKSGDKSGEKGERNDNADE